jgi:hypothetical protein
MNQDEWDAINRVRTGFDASLYEGLWEYKGFWMNQDEWDAINRVRTG